MVTSWRNVVFACFLVLLLLLVACGGAEPTATSAPTSTPRPTATSVPPTPTAPSPATPTLAPTAARVPATATPVPVTPSPAPVRPKTGGTLRTYQTRNEEGWDFHRAQNSTVWVSATPMYSWLVAYDQAKGQFVPDLAERWELSQDGRTYTFFINKNATWHDGRPVTADDIIYNLERIQGKRDLASPVYSSTLALVTAVKKQDDKTVTLTLSQASASFLPGLGVVGNMFYPSHVPGPYQDNNNPPPGSGPFKFGKLTADVSTTFVRNGNYWKKDQFGAQLPYLDALQVFIISDVTAARSAFRTNQLDATFPFGSSPFLGVKEQTLRDLPGTRIVDFASPLGIMFRNVPPYSDVRVRKAFNYSLDRAAVAELYYPGESKSDLLFSYWGSVWNLPDSELKKLPGYNSANRQQDLAQAKQLLDAALKDANLSLSTWRPVLIHRQIYDSYAAILQDQWKRSVGLQLDTKSVDNPTQLQVAISGTFEITIQGTAAALDDPSQFLGGYFKTGAGLNYARMSDPQVDKALDDIEATLDIAKRKQLTLDLEKKLYELSWIVTFIGEPQGVALRPEVRNWYRAFGQDNYTGQYEQVWLDK